jgi:hypothetical protein
MKEKDRTKRNAIESEIRAAQTALAHCQATLDLGKNTEGGCMNILGAELKAIRQFQPSPEMHQSSSSTPKISDTSVVVPPLAVNLA